MDQTRGIDRSKPIMNQIIEVLDKRYFVEEEGAILGGRFQLHKKVAAAIISLTSDYYFKHPNELKEYVED